MSEQKSKRKSKADRKHLSHTFPTHYSVHHAKAVIHDYLTDLGYDKVQDSPLIYQRGSTLKSMHLVIGGPPSSLESFWEIDIWQDEEEATYVSVELHPQVPDGIAAFRLDWQYWTAEIVELKVILEGGESNLKALRWADHRAWLLGTGISILMLLVSIGLPLLILWWMFF